MNDFADTIKAQFAELQNKQQWLEIRFEGNRAIITGKYCLFAIFENEEFLDSFEIEVTINKGFPYLLPTIKEVSKKIRKKGFDHKYSDGSLCLEVATKMAI